MKSFFVVVSVISLQFLGCSNFLSFQRSPIETFRAEVDSVLTDSIFTAADAAIKIMSLESGEVLYERNSKKLMRPASNLKLLTSSTALCVLGGNFSIPTKILYDGEIRDSVLIGNLYVKGYGDPDFMPQHFVPLVSEIKKLGIHKISGNLVGDTTYFDEKRWGVGWMWDDEPSDYSAFNSPLTISRNCVQVNVHAGQKIGDTVAVDTDPPTKFVTVENMAVTDTSNTLEISRKLDEQINIVTVKGTKKLDTLSRKELVSVRHPELYFLTLLKEELNRQQIDISGNIQFSNIPATATSIAQHSQPIDSMIIFLNKESDNLSAENTLKILGAEKFGVPGTTEHGISMVKQTMSSFGIDTTKFLMVDGSGVSHYNLVTADMYITLLKEMYKKKELFNLFFNSLPNAGIDGTLEDRMKHTSAENNLHAKTGTISGVSSLSGYVRTAEGEMLAFSIFMQNFIGSSRPYRTAQDAIGILMANFSKR
ncbi:MAG: D-alanyl-D-alanine carboxypeptidase/D-alanyl-D-alanine-endopeptidase [Bacteroidota bacterium]|nr:D-alanyl-D-alanine carboxypeptidase/D-alanyl-D-alanine-endopeptidase [Bacteroidota bacterium]